MRSMRKSGSVAPASNSERAIGGRLAVSVTVRWSSTAPVIRSCAEELTWIRNKPRNTAVADRAACRKRMRTPDETEILGQNVTALGLLIGAGGGYLQKNRLLGTFVLAPRVKWKDTEISWLRSNSPMELRCANRPIAGRRRKQPSYTTSPDGARDIFRWARTDICTCIRTRIRSARSI